MSAKIYVEGGGDNRALLDACQHMKEIVATINQSSQVTIPAEVRRVLGLGPKGKVAFTIEDDQVSLASAPFTLESAYGSVKPIRQPGRLEDVAQAAKDTKAEQSTREPEST